MKDNFGYMPDPYQNMGMGGYAPPLALPSERADLLDKIRPNKIVFETMHMLLGEVQNSKGDWVRDPRLRNKALSFVGAWDIATLMLPVSSQNVSISKLDNGEIRQRTRNINRTAMRMCLRNWKEYNITGVEQLWFIHEIIFSNTFITLKQPQDEGIRRLLQNFDAGGIVPIQQEQSQPMHTGILGRLFRK